jgi:cysteinyl-tRNA synthetase
MAAGKAAAERLRQAVAVEDTGAGDPLEADSYRDRFIAAMEDDLNTAQALAVLFDLAREINRARDAGRGIREAQAQLRELTSVLGLKLASEAPVEAAPFIELLITIRRELREAKQYQLADRIRNGLGELGIVLEDGAGGTTWKSR